MYEYHCLLLRKGNILLFHYTVCVKMQISFDPIFICCISFRNSFCLYLILTSYGFHMKPSFLFSLYSSNTNLVFSDFNPNACCLLLFLLWICIVYNKTIANIAMQIWLLAVLCSLSNNHDPHCNKFLGMKIYLKSSSVWDYTFIFKFLR